MPRRRTFICRIQEPIGAQGDKRQQSAVELCRQHQIKTQLLSDWEAAFLANAATVFQSDGRLLEAEQPIAELERQIGRQTMELEAAKQALSISTSASLRNERS